MSNSFVYLNENNELHKFNMNITSNETNLTFDNNLLINGNLNFSGDITKNGNPFHQSRWTEDSSNISYTAGNVGIGTASPTHPLHVSGSTLLSGSTYLYGTVYRSDGSQCALWKKSGSNAYWDDGNVGIGTSSPGYTLDVAGSLYGGSITSGSYLRGASQRIHFAYSGSVMYMSNPSGTNYNSITRAGSHMSYHDDGTNLSFNLTNTSNMHTSSNNYQFFSGNSEKIRITGDAKEQMKFYDNGGAHYFNIAKFTTFPSGYGQWTGLHFPTAQMGAGEHAVIGGFNGEGYWFAQNGDAAGFSNPADYSALTFYDEDGASSTMSASWYISGTGGSINGSDIRIKTEVNTYKNNNYEKYKKIRTVTYKKKYPKILNQKD